MAPASAAATSPPNVSSPSPTSPQLQSLDPVPLRPSFAAIADTYASIGLTSSAIFHASNAHALSPSHDNTLRLARLHSTSGNHRHAIHLLDASTQSPDPHPHARLLAAHSLLELGHLDACLALLGDQLPAPDPHNSEQSDKRPAHQQPHLDSAQAVLRASVHERQDNLGRATLWYKHALQADIFCVDAFHRIVHAFLISPDDARQFIHDVTEPILSNPHSDSPAAWLASYYRAAADPTIPIPTSPPSLLSSLDVRHLKALRAFNALDFHTCASIISDMLRKNPHLSHHMLVIYLAALVELDDRQQLFVIAHKLVDDDPKAPIPWLAVAYYYFASGKPDLCRQFLRKATTIDARLAPAWIALGHAFAAQDESDQAMAAYRTAGRLFPGAQLPPLFMGIEYARQGSLPHAILLFETALKACKSDPAPRHELGVAHYSMGNFKRAIAYFSEALSLWKAPHGAKSCVTGRRADAEEATLVNLGHCHRRLEQFVEAKRCYERALALRPRSPVTCTALGMTHHAMGDSQTAIVLYHRALRENPGDALSNDLLERALSDRFDYGYESYEDGQANDEEEER